MERGSGSTNSCRRKGSEGIVLCFCGVEAKISRAWTDKNPGRRFYGCERFKRGGACKFFKWYDEEEGFGWQKEALLEARNEIREKSKMIEDLRKTISELRMDLKRKEEAEEEIINSFLKL